MNNSKKYFLLISFLIGLIIPQINMGQTIDSSQSKMSCEEALKNVHNVKVGMKVDEIIGLIGTPGVKTDERWNYSFWDCSPPPKTGEQIIIGVSLVLKENIVTEINWATICATGPGNWNPPKKKKKKSLVK